MRKIAILALKGLIIFKTSNLVYYPMWRLKMKGFDMAYYSALN